MTLLYLANEDSQKRSKCVKSNSKIAFTNWIEEPWLSGLASYTLCKADGGEGDICIGCLTRNEFNSTYSQAKPQSYPGDIEQLQAFRRNHKARRLLDSYASSSSRCVRSTATSCPITSPTKDICLLCYPENMIEFIIEQNEKINNPYTKLITDYRYERKYEIGFTSIGGIMGDGFGPYKVVNVLANSYIVTLRPILGTSTTALEIQGSSSKNNSINIVCQFSGPKSLCGSTYLITNTFNSKKLFQKKYNIKDCLKNITVSFGRLEAIVNNAMVTIDDSDTAELKPTKTIDSQKIVSYISGQNMRTTRTYNYKIPIYVLQKSNTATSNSETTTFYFSYFTNNNFVRSFVQATTAET
jgi:hypothetical protein